MPDEDRNDASAALIRIAEAPGLPDDADIAAVLETLGAAPARNHGRARPGAGHAPRRPRPNRCARIGTGRTPSPVAMPQARVAAARDEGRLTPAMRDPGPVALPTGSREVRGRHILVPSAPCAHLLERRHRPRIGRPGARAVEAAAAALCRQIDIAPTLPAR